MITRSYEECHFCSLGQRVIILKIICKAKKRYNYSLCDSEFCDINEETMLVSE